MSLSLRSGEFTPPDPGPGGAFLSLPALDEASGTIVSSFYSPGP